MSSAGIDQVFRELRRVVKQFIFTAVPFIALWCHAAESPEFPLTSVRAVRSLPAQQALQKRAIHLRGVVTALSGWKDSFFLQDQTAGISVDRSDHGPTLQAGDLVEVVGVSGPGLFAPVVIANAVRVLGVSPLPTAPVFELANLMSGTEDSQRLAIRGIVRSAEVKPIWGRTVLSLRIQTTTGELTARVLKFSGDTDRLVDAEVLIKGVCATNFNDHGQLVGVRFFVPDLADVSIEKPAPSDRYSTHLQSLSTLFRFGQPLTPNHRLRLRGVVTYQQLGKQLYIEEDGRGLAIHTSQKTVVQPGTRIELIGFSSPGAFSPVIEDALFRELPGTGLIPAVRVRADEIIQQKDGFREAPQNGLLVTIKAQLVDQVERGHEQILLLREGNTAFSARLELPESRLGQLSGLEPNSVIDVTGICSIQMDAGDEPTSFEILLRSAKDIRLVKAPSWWNVAHIFNALATTVILAALAFGSAFILGRRLKLQHRVLLKSEKLFRETLENLPLLTIGLDREGRANFCNEASLKAMERTREEVIGQDWHSQFVSPACMDETTPVLLETEHYVLRARHESQLYSKSGKSRFISWYNSVLHDAVGSVTGTVSIGEDITQRRLIEKELMRASDAAAAASRAKSEFLANMSHEIRTPMNGIIGMTDLVLDSELTADQRENLEMVKASADGLMTIINDILDFSKIEAGKLSLDPIPFNLESSIGETIKNLSVVARQKGLELISEISRDVPAELIGDPGRLRQVLLNLIGNALKFTSTGEIRVNVETESRSGESVALHFCVWDTGIGMSEVQRGKIFHAFTQAETSISRQFGGTGLGLTISARLVDMFGGRIWVESAIGSGSRFHFTATFALGIQPALAPVAGGPVLVVDDHISTRQLLADSLATCGLQAVLVNTGAEALTELKRALGDNRPYSLVIIDLHVADMDGFDLSRHIRLISKPEQTRIVLLTSIGQRGDALRCKDLQIDGYLQTPVRRSDLVQFVLTVLDGRPVEASVSPQLITRHTLRETRRRILLAEDSAVNQRLAVKLLERRGHEVVVANNGQEALDALHGDPFDLILMDVEMPVLNGFQATAAIRATEQNGGQRSRIVAMTAHAMKGDKERCLAAGMDDYLSKPIRPEELYAMLETAGVR